MTTSFPGQIWTHGGGSEFELILRAGVICFSMRGTPPWNPVYLNTVDKDGFDRILLAGSHRFSLTRYYWRTYLRHRFGVTGGDEMIRAALKLIRDKKDSLLP